jgi:hypothetical protein
MQRLQNALTKQLTDEHERVDLQLREKVTDFQYNFVGRGSQEDQKEKRGDWCSVVWSSTSIGQDVNYF